MNITKPQIFTAIISIGTLGLACIFFAPALVEKIVLAAIVAISNLGMALLQTK